MESPSEFALTPEQVKLADFIRELWLGVVVDAGANREPPFNDFFSSEREARLFWIPQSNLRKCAIRLRSGRRSPIALVDHGIDAWTVLYRKLLSAVS